MGMSGVCERDGQETRSSSYNCHQFMCVKPLFFILFFYWAWLIFVKEKNIFPKKTEWYSMISYYTYFLSDYIPLLLKCKFFMTHFHAQAKVAKFSILVKYKSCTPFFSACVPRTRNLHGKKAVSCRFAQTHYNLHQLSEMCIRGFQSFNVNLMEKFNLLMILALVKIKCKQNRKNRCFSLGRTAFFYSNNM
jgi:hypothetical protein